MEMADALRRFRAGGPPPGSAVRFLLVMLLPPGSWECEEYGGECADGEAMVSRIGVGRHWSVGKTQVLRGPRMA